MLRLLTLAALTAVGLLTCGCNNNQAPAGATGPGMPPNVQEDFNRRMQQSGAPSGQTAPGGGGGVPIQPGMPAGAPSAPR